MMQSQDQVPTPTSADVGEKPAVTPEPVPAVPPKPEIGGRPGPDPTRYGDWEKNGRCIDF